MEKLIVAPAPHAHSGDSVRRNMLLVIAALIPAYAVSIVAFGWGALITMAIVTLPAVQSRNSARSLFIQRMQSEIATAVRLTTSLSRNAGANSAAILAQIRSNVYAIGLINDISIGQEGVSGRLLREDQVTTLQSAIDNYLAFLTTGMDTGEYQTNLQNSLETLQTEISILE